MSLLEPFFDQARTLGLDPNAPITPAGMAYILAKCESYGCLRVTTGMAEDWHIALQVWAHQHHTNVFPLSIGIAAAVQHGLSGAHFTTPSELFNAITTYKKTQIRKALAGQQGPDIPEHIAHQGLKTELAYRKTWMKNAALTGNGPQTDKLTREQFNLPEKDPPRHITAIPQEIKEKLANLYKKDPTQ